MWFVFEFFTNLKNNVAVRTAMWQNGTPFKDVESGSAYADAILYAYETGLVVGTSAAVFGPDAPVTMAQMLTMLWRRAGEPEVGGTASDAWYARAAAWAFVEGLVDDFDPNAALTGEDCAMLLWRFAKVRGMDVSVGEDTNILSYNDADKISAYAMPAMQWACGAGLMNGDDKGNRLPQASATRAEAAALFQRFAEKVK